MGKLFQKTSGKMRLITSVIVLLSVASLASVTASGTIRGAMLTIDSDVDNERDLKAAKKKAKKATKKGVKKAVKKAAKVKKGKKMRSLQKMWLKRGKVIKDEKLVK